MTGNCLCCLSNALCMARDRIHMEIRVSVGSCMGTKHVIVRKGPLRPHGPWETHLLCNRFLHARLVVPGARGQRSEVRSVPPLALITPLHAGEGETVETPCVVCRCVVLSDLQRCVLLTTYGGPPATPPGPLPPLRVTSPDCPTPRPGPIPTATMPSVELVATQSRSLHTQSLQLFVHSRCMYSEKVCSPAQPWKGGSWGSTSEDDKECKCRFQFGTGTGVGALAGGIPVTVRRGGGNYLLAVFSSTCHARRTPGGTSHSVTPVHPSQAASASPIATPEATAGRRAGDC